MDRERDQWGGGLGSLHRRVGLMGRSGTLTAHANLLRSRARFREGDPAASVERLREDGYIVLRGVLSAAECDAVREHVLRTSDEAKAQGRNDLFGNIQEQRSRCVGRVQRT